MKKKLKICYLNVSWENNIPTIHAECKNVSYRETAHYYYCSNGKRLEKLHYPQEVGYFSTGCGYNIFNPNYAYALDLSAKELYRIILKKHYDLAKWNRRCVEFEIQEGLDFHTESQVKRMPGRYNMWTTRINNLEKATKKFLNKYH